MYSGTEALVKATLHSTGSSLGRGRVRMPVGNDDEVPGIDRVDVKERRHSIVAIDDARRRPPARDVTEDESFMATRRA